MTLKGSSEIVLKRFQNFRIEAAFQTPTLYIFHIQPKDATTIFERITDSFYSVDKETGELSDYAPLLDIDNFNTAIQEPLYLYNRRV